MTLDEHALARGVTPILCAGLLASLALFTSSHGAYATCPKLSLVKFDTVEGHAAGGVAQGGATIGDANRGAADVVFTSRGFPAGSIIRNGTTVAVTDLHIVIDNAGVKPEDRCCFDPRSNGGAAFPKTTISPNRTEITFEGGNIPVGDSFWSYIPLSADFAGGKCKYKGRATPTK